MRKERVPGSGQIDDESPFLLELRAHRGPARRRKRRLVIVSVYGRSGPPVQQGIGAAGQNRSRVAWIDPCSSSRQHDFLDVTLGESPLSRGNLDDCRTMLGALRRRDRQRDGHGRDQCERQKNRENRTPPTSGEWPKVRPPGHLHPTTSSLCMPAMKWPAILQNSSYRPGARWRRTRPTPLGATPSTVATARSASSSTVRPSRRSGNRERRARTMISSCVSGPWFLTTNSASPAR